MGKSIAEEIVYRQSLMKHPAKEGASRARRKYRMEHQVTSDLSVSPSPQSS